MKNLVFDLGGVVVARDKSKCPKGMTEFFAFIFHEKMPPFWVEYDRGTLSRTEVERELVAHTGCDAALCHRYMDLAVALQEEIPTTAALIRRAQQAGYRLYVLSNMSREFIAHIRQLPVYRCFEGGIVSCEHGVVKPERRIYELLLEGYGLVPAETLFIDDRPENLTAAARFGMATFHFADRTNSCTELARRLGIG